MALNPFFLQGSRGEQSLVQDLINEQLKMYGIDVYYLPRNYIKVDNILNEVESSKFDDSFMIEAYLDNYEGYAPGSDLMTKFGLRLKNEVNLIISRERYEIFITPFMQKNNVNEDPDLLMRPREGDLIYFPLGKRLFEIKKVEFEKPFYQLGKNYVYELLCELYEYENEVIDTSIDEIDRVTEDEGYITTLEFVGTGSSARVTPIVGQGYVNTIYLDNDGYGYTSTPNVIIESPDLIGGNTAKAKAVMQTLGGVTSIKEILLNFCGAGYTVAPQIQIVGGGGSGAIATCGISTDLSITGVIGVSINDGGSGYTNSTASITISPPSQNVVGATTAIFEPIISNGVLVDINIKNPGIGYTSSITTSDPRITLSNPNDFEGTGSYVYNEIITGTTSGVKARVKSWNSVENKLEVYSISSNSSNINFYEGEIVVGSSSSASYRLKNYNNYNSEETNYDDNERIEIEADTILDFTESNPFGEY